MLPGSDDLTFNCFAVSVALYVALLPSHASFSSIITFYNLVLCLVRTNLALRGYRCSDTVSLFLFFFTGVAVPSHAVNK